MRIHQESLWNVFLFIAASVLARKKKNTKNPSARRTIIVFIIEYVPVPCCRDIPLGYVDDCRANGPAISRAVIVAQRTKSRHQT